ncbi:MAG: DNA repair protein RecO [Patescibacteria group bacterium]
MNEFYKTEGIIIGKRDFSEADKLLIVLTPDMGKITIKAKGLKKTLAKMSGHLELFNQVKIEMVQGRTFFIATGAQTIENFNNAKNDFSRMSTLYYLGELVNNLVPDHIPQKEVYQNLVQAIAMVSANTFDMAIVTLSFEVQLLHLLGYKPELGNCVVCHNAVIAEGFCMSVEKGGVMCTVCGHDDWQTRTLSTNALKAMRLMGSYNFDTVSKVRIEQGIVGELRSILDLLLEQQMGKRLKSRSFLQAIV